MGIDSRINRYMQDNKVYGNNIPDTVNKIFKGINSSKISRSKIHDSLKELSELGYIRIEKGVVKNNSYLLTGTYLKGKEGRGRIISVQNGRTLEYFVPASASLQAPHESTVKFVVADREKGMQKAQVTQVLEAQSNLIYGTVENKEGVYYFIPDDVRFAKNIKMYQDEFAKQAVGKRCAVNIITKESKDHEKTVYAKINDEKQIFGFINNPLANIQSLLAESRVPLEFSDKVYEEVSEIDATVTKEELKGRLDLRNEPFITIDPATCKDRDDAVLIKPLIKNGIPVGHRLYVAIADVSNYVKPRTEIDQEAYKRGTSIYPAGTVIPMLPEKLSNGICSLNEGVDRLVMVVTMDFNNRGKMLGYNVDEAVINNKKVFSYEEVSSLHHNEPEALSKFKDYKELVDRLYDFSNCIKKHNEKVGTLDIQGYEPTIVLNKEKDKVEDYRNDNYVDSHEVIEYTAVSANYCIANLQKRLGINNIYRNHEFPSDDRFDQLCAKLSEFGIDVEGDADNFTYQKMLKLIEELPASKVLNSLVVRSMRKAKYDIDPEVGHFALALDDYTHFTSPIRRYVDLIEHRLVKQSLEIIKATIKEHNIETQGKYLSDLVDTVRHYKKDAFKNIMSSEVVSENAAHLNICDRRADEVSEKADLACAVLFIKENYLGKVVQGYVSKIEKGHVIVTLFDENDLEHSNIIEVTVPTIEFPAFKGTFVDDNKVSLHANKSKRTLCTLGDMISVKIMEADVNTRTIIATPDLTKELSSQTEEGHQLA